MRLIATAVLCLFATAAQARCPHGETVSWYAGLHSPTGEPGCASREFGKGTRLKVTAGKRTHRCIVNDYGPAAWTGCRLDVSRKGARELAIVDRGVVKARIERVEPQIVAHPTGCPARAFCGCGASIEVFGRSIRELWLARNWFRFPRAAPAPGMVAVRNHHVFVIRAVMGSGRVLAYDANSGGHQTRIHERSLAGYSVRNPHGSRYAQAR